MTVEVAACKRLELARGLRCGLRTTALRLERTLARKAPLRLVTTRPKAATHGLLSPVAAPVALGGHSLAAGEDYQDQCAEDPHDSDDQGDQYDRRHPEDCRLRTRPSHGRRRCGRRGCRSDLDS